MHMSHLVLLVALLASCSTNKREYQPPASDMAQAAAPRHRSSGGQPPYARSLLPEYGEVIGLSYSKTTEAGEDAVGVLSGAVSMNPLPLLGLFAGAGDAHVPTYRIRLKGVRHELFVRDPDCPPMVRGTQVIVTPRPDGGYKVRPCRY